MTAFGVDKHPSHACQISRDFFSVTSTYHLMGVFARNILQMQEFSSSPSLRSGQKADYYVEASHWLHIETVKGAEIVLTPEAA